jgi:hypothetical protein
MSRVDQVERMADREAEHLAEQLESGAITREQYNDGMREIQRDVRAAYEEDREDALRDVDADWGRL